MRELLECRQCPRLVDNLQRVKREYPHYHCKPVAAFGAGTAGLLIVGLAPGKHGANATGIPFTGDAAGKLLYQTLFDFGFSSRDESTSGANTLQLHNCRITNAVKCLPPQNKPLSTEINQCNRYLRSELNQLKDSTVILALGQIAHKAILKALGLKQSRYPFAHAAEHQLNQIITLIDSYHCSRYNTQTKRLTETMFQDVFKRIRVILSGDVVNA